jgi:hypothetical protein
MNARTIGLVTLLAASSLHAATRTSADYSITAESYDAAGAVLSSANYSVKGASVGTIAALTSVTSPAITNKSGYVGQLYDVQGLSVAATPTNVNETLTAQLSAAPLLDDATTLANLDPSSVSWSVVSGPIASINTSGVATTGNVYQNTIATASGSYQSNSGQGTLTVLNVGTDDFQSYGGDGIDDAWQVQYFSQPPNSNAGPNADLDGDGESNLSEYRSGTNPTNPNSVVHSARQLNISTRLRVLTDNNVLIGGFIITGTDPKKVIIRGIGPSLTAFGVPGALENPVLELHDHTGATIAVNDNWKEAPNASEVLNSGLAPGNDLEAAILQTLVPDAYTVVVSGANGGTGVGLVEAYDLAQGVPSKLANISTRGFVDAGDNVMIGGFIIGGGLGNNGNGSERVIVRAIGPSLTPFGINNALQDPTLELHDGNGNTIAVNDNWQDGDQAAAIQASGLAPSNDLESAILMILPSGPYTAVVRGNTDGTGVGLVEAYNLTTQ